MISDTPRQRGTPLSGSVSKNLLGEYIMPNASSVPAQYRQEWKYICTQAQLDVLKHRLLTVMNFDRHQLETHSYHIRSLYFDDIANRGLQENEGGLDKRRKFRLRIYNHSAELIRLEIKYKFHGLTRKDSCPVSLELCQALMAGRPIPFREEYPEPLKQLYLEMQTRRMRPVTIVEYDRTAFVYPTGNVRITFDRNIAASDHIERFLMPQTFSIPVLPTDQHILEVKFDGFLPSQIRDVVDVGHLNRTAFSKYYICRTKYHRGIIQ